MFHFSVHNANDLESIVAAIKKSKQELGSNLGGINLMNQERLLSMMTEFPLENIQSMEPLNAGTIKNLTNKLDQKRAHDSYTAEWQQCN